MPAKLGTAASRKRTLRTRRWALLKRRLLLWKRADDLPSATGLARRPPTPYSATPARKDEAPDTPAPGDTPPAAAARGGAAGSAARAPAGSARRWRRARLGRRGRGDPRRIPPDGGGRWCAPGGSRGGG